VDHAITLRDIFWPVIIIIGCIIALGTIAAILSFFANAFKD